MSYTEADIRSLVVKVETLDLTAGERAALEDILNAAQADEVEGFLFRVLPAPGAAGAASQFQIQVGTSDLQNAENVRSQAQKRLEDQRQALVRNWAG